MALHKFNVLHVIYILSLVQVSALLTCFRKTSFMFLVKFSVLLVVVGLAATVANAQILVEQPGDQSPYNWTESSYTNSGEFDNGTAIVSSDYETQKLVFLTGQGGNQYMGPNFGFIDFPDLPQPVCFEVVGFSTIAENNGLLYTLQLWASGIFGLFGKFVASAYYYVGFQRDIASGPCLTVSTIKTDADKTPEIWAFMQDYVVQVPQANGTTVPVNIYPAGAIILNKKIKGRPDPRLFVMPSRCAHGISPPYVASVFGNNAVCEPTE